MSGVFNYMFSFFVNTEDPSQTACVHGPVGNKQETGETGSQNTEEEEKIPIPSGYNYARDSLLVRELKNNNLFKRLRMRCEDPEGTTAIVIPARFEVNQDCELFKELRKNEIFIKNK